MTHRNLLITPMSDGRTVHGHLMPIIYNIEMTLAGSAAELQIQILLEHVEFASLISSDAATVANARCKQIREAVELLEEHQQRNAIKNLKSIMENA